MTMPHVQPRLRIALAIGAVAVAGIGAVTAMAASASQHAVLAAQPSSQYVFACVNAKTGKIDYFEFKTPLPHQCNSGDELWHLAAGPAVTATACATPTATATPTPSATATPCPPASPSATATGSATPAAWPTG